MKDLFENKTKRKKRIPRIEKELYKYDKDSFPGRLERLKLIDKYMPKGFIISGDMEFVYTFSEAKDCFIAGHFIATIILAQSFIEKIFHLYFENNGLDSVAKRGLDKMIKYAKRHKLIDPFILNKVDNLRLKRNPFTHLKDYSYPHSLSKRMVAKKTFIQPVELLEKDATEAIEVMLFLTTHKL